MCLGAKLLLKHLLAALSLLFFYLLYVKCMLIMRCVHVCYMCYAECSSLVLLVHREEQTRVDEREGTVTAL